MCIRDSFQLGTYEDDPIIWRCISDDDENGMLLLSDKILCQDAIFKIATALLGRKFKTRLNLK